MPSPFEASLRFALAALDMGLADREQVLWAVAEWARTPSAGSLEAMLTKQAELDATCLFSIREVVEGGGPKSVDATVRDALSAVVLPAEAAAWLATIPARGERGVFAAAAPGERYRLGAPIASGGLGRVFEAEDRDLGRGVALKLLKDGCTPRDEERFLREARLAARLEHPVIVPTYDFGAMSDGKGGRKLFLCMKRIRGRDLAKLVESIAIGEADASWTRSRLLAVVRDVCLGVAYAHSKGVIHRDLKPSNVMVGEFGETMIVDWGIAKVLGEAEEASGGAAAAVSPESTHLTAAGSVIGTPAYMSPEQAAGRLGDIDARSDVYGLGGILYAVLTWQAPNATPPAIRVQQDRDAGDDTPDDVPPELNAICLKALARERGDRFQSALDLARELQRFMDGVLDRERRLREAAERVAAGRALVEKYRASEAEVRAKSAELDQLDQIIPRHEAAAVRRPLWELQAARQALQDARIETYAKAAAEFGQARAVDPSSEAAADGLCDLYFARLAEMEKRRERGEELLLRNQIANLGARHRAKLEAPGSVSIRAAAYRCRCLARVTAKEWRAEIDTTPTLVWKDGGPVAGAAEPRDRMIPEHRMHGGTWGHTAACRREPVDGAEIRVARYETVDVRFVLGPATPLGTGTLPPGSYRATVTAPGFAPALVPFVIRRDEAVALDVTLYRPEEIPAGFVQIPGGRFPAGGIFAGGEEEADVRTGDLFMQRFSVTAGEYMDFLNDLVKRGRRDEARARAPRENNERFLRETDAGFELSPPGERSALTAREFPAIGLSWQDALAYAAWLSARDGRFYSLPHEHEWEKAARGADRRVYPYGDEAEWSYAHVAGSLPEGTKLLPVGSFPVDESPYGVRDMAGCATNWVLNNVEVPYRHYRGLRGGAWFIGSANSRIPYRRGFVAETTMRYYGARLCLRPVRWDSA